MTDYRRTGARTSMWRLRARRIRVRTTEAGGRILCFRFVRKIAADDPSIAWANQIAEELARLEFCE
jgi:hypothetical protein